MSFIDYAVIKLPISFIRICVLFAKLRIKPHHLTF